MYSRLAQALQAQLGDIGVRLDLEVQPSVQYLAQIQQGAYEAWVQPLATDRPDVSSFWSAYYLPDGGFNVGHYEVPGIRDGITQLRKTTDTAAKSAIMKKMVDATLDGGPLLLPICQQEILLAATSRVGGLDAPAYWFPIPSVRNVYLRSE